MNESQTPNPMNDDDFGNSLRGLLRGSEEKLDYTTAARLSAARARAIEAAQRPLPVLAPWWTVPGATAAAAMLAWLLLPMHLHVPASGPGTAATPQVEVIETLADDKTQGVYDDLEFYQWLADADSHG